MSNGQLLQLNKSSALKGTDTESGQRATLQCTATYFVKDMSDKLLNGKLLNQTNVACRYHNLLPIWSDTETGYPVKCDKECVADEDCFQTDKQFCINHRYKNHNFAGPQILKILYIHIKPLTGQFLKVYLCLFQMQT